MGKDFINYRKQNLPSSRERFSYRVRAAGQGKVPIVIDSVDKELSEAIAEALPNRPCRFKYGKELVLHMDSTVLDVIREVKIILMQNKKDYLFEKHRLTIGLENGTILQETDDLGNLYKKYQHGQDKILYLLLSRETTMYGYILSIIKYLSQVFTTDFWSKSSESVDELY